MKFLPLLALTALAALTGCQSTKYTHFSSCDLEGTVTAEWIAEGPVQKVERGYKIHAVERTVHGNVPLTTRYPNGWNTFVTGPSILFERTSKPLWISELDGETTEEETVTTTTHERSRPQK